MPNPDPSWTAFYIVHERAVAWALDREYRRLATCCGCPDPTTALNSA